ncbi:MAG: VOC family protein [Blastocatellia bacterium]
MGIKTLFLGLAIGSLLSAQTSPAAQEERAHFHHVHLNVTNPEKTLQYYRRVFGATPVKYNDAVDALYTERSFILLNKVDAAPPGALNTGIWHMGWGGVDMTSEAVWLKAMGVDIHTPLTPLGPSSYYMYLSGPDKELIEINTMGHHRFGHIHLFADDVNETAHWYADHLGVTPRQRDVPRQSDPNTRSRWVSNSFRVDNVNLIVFAKPDTNPPPTWWPDPPLKELQPTKGRPIDHIAFSYRRIEPVYERMKKAGAQIIEPITMREGYGFKSFFALAPNKVLIEIVEAPPIPEGIWD